MTSSAWPQGHEKAITPVSKSLFPMMSQTLRTDRIMRRLQVRLWENSYVESRNEKLITEIVYTFINHQKSVEIIKLNICRL